MKKYEANTGFRRLLTEARWTHRQAAQAINRVGTETGHPLKYDESAITRWLNGTLPRKAVRAIILEAFSRRLSRPVTHEEVGFPKPVGAPAVTDLVEGLIDLGRLDMDPSRRGVLGVGLFSIALTAPDWPDVVGRMEAAASGRAVRIGRPEVDMVVSMTERLSDLDDEYGGRHARPMAAAFLVNTIAPYLRAEAAEPVRKRMLSAASDLCYLTGYMAVDEGLQGLAQRYYLKALELAGAAEDHLTYCTTLRGMSVQAAELGHGHQALRLADASAASPQAGPRMRAFLTGQQAWAAALTGDRNGALRHIGETERALDKADSMGKVVGRYDASALNFHISKMRYALGDKKGAVEAMQRADRLRNDGYRRSRVRGRAMLAECQLDVGHLDAACATWHLALDDYPLVQSGRCDQRIATMRALLRPHLANPAARHLHERARALAA